WERENFDEGECFLEIKDARDIEIKEAETPLETPHEALRQETDKLVGARIGEKYLVVSVIGQGGMGTVLKVKHETLNKFFAAKVLSSSVAVDDKAIRRFDQEAKAASALNHPNIVGVHDYGLTADGSPYMVLDFIDGKSLAEEIKQEGHIE